LRILAAAIALLVSAATSQAQSDPRPDAHCGRVEAIVDSIRTAAGMPAMAAAIATREGILCSVATGYADVEGELPATTATRFRVGSVSKILTAHAVARLAENGRLDLDVPIQTYVPDFPDKPWPITARALAAHTAGIRHYTLFESVMPNDVRYTTATAGLERFGGDSLLFTPGDRYAYSSYGFNLLGAAVEGASGKPFPEAMRELMLEPLGLTATAPDTLPPGPDRAVDYERSRSGPVHPATPDDTSYKWPSGGYISTADDLARFAIAHLDDARVSPAMRALLFTPQRFASGEEIVVQEGRGIGLGWRIERDDAGRRILHHGGAGRGNRAMVLLYPDDGLAVTYIGNLPAMSIGIAEAQQIAALFLPAAGR
jgi:CubicO group peptidase (beta-lactamase class C family)